MDFPLLKSTLEARGAGPFTAVNQAGFMNTAITVAGPPIARQKIKSILLAGDNLDAATATPPVGASIPRKAAPIILGDPDFDPIDGNDAKIQAVFQALRDDGVITAGQFSSIAALKDISIPRWKSLGFEHAIEDVDVQKAGATNTVG